MKTREIFLNGLIKENPSFRMVLGMCPSLAVTTSAINGLGMGMATTFVLIGSNIAISLLRNIIPERVRIPCFITIIAGFVTIVQQLLKAFVPSIDNALGIFIPLIVVNCIILARAEMFASKNTVYKSIIDALGMGAGFCAALILMGGFRELLGNGTVFGFDVFGGKIEPALIMILPPGGFLAFGLILAAINSLSGIKISQKEICKGCSMKCNSCISGSKG